jgi:short-subunit dehydrogenase
MKVAGSTALVTGANRGLGLAFAKVLVEMDAAKVYAAARVAGYINLLINNAGIARPGGFLADGAVEPAREQFEVNFVGPLRMARAFAPVLAKNGGGAIINVLSVASWMNGPTLATYGASKSAAWALTNGLRIELATTGHPGRRAACSLHRHRPCTRFRRAEEFARGNRADDARRPRPRGR